MSRGAGVILDADGKPYPETQDPIDDLRARITRAMFRTEPEGTIVDERGNRIAGDEPLAGLLAWMPKSEDG